MGEGEDFSQTRGFPDASRRALLSRNPGGERWGSTMGGGWKREQESVKRMGLWPGEREEGSLREMEAQREPRMQ